MPTIVHFEIPARDIQRAKNFYKNLFSWKFKKIIADKSEYLVISTKDRRGERGLSGAMIKKTTNYVDSGNYIGVNSIDESLFKVKELRGKIIIPKTLIRGHGYFAKCKDTEGNSFSLWQEDKNTVT